MLLLLELLLNLLLELLLLHVLTMQLELGGLCPLGKTLNYMKTL